MSSCKNTFFQICDIDDEEIQALVHQNDKEVCSNKITLFLFTFNYFFVLNQPSVYSKIDGWCDLNTVVSSLL